MKLDETHYHEKYNVTRTDGKPVGRTFTIEIDKDPQSAQLLKAIADLYHNTRPYLADDLRTMAANLISKDGE